MRGRNHSPASSPQRGESGADGRLLEAVYGELRALAAAKLAGEAPGHTLQPTALVHEAWLRLGGDAQPDWQNRRHFFGAVAEAMRRILIDRARRRRADRHGGGQERVDLEGLDVAAAARSAELLALDEALEQLATTAPEQAEVVKLHFFAGLSFAEIAATLQVSERTAKRWWAFARAWLHAAMQA